MLENRSFDHMLGFLYTDNGNVSPLRQPYEGLNGTESNPVSAGSPVSVFRIGPSTPNAYFMPGADPGEGYMATNAQLFGGAEGATVPSTAPGNVGFVTDFAYTLSWQAPGGPVDPAHHRQRHHGLLHGRHMDDKTHPFTSPSIFGAAQRPRLAADAAGDHL